ncbi:MAG: hypothetical protein AAGJ46_09390 [Planctomycetota bacterium]
MAASNRAAKITKLVTALKKQYKPVKPPAAMPVLETLLFGCLLEKSSHEAATTAFEQLRESYFDWNEVRVTTKVELAEACKALNDPQDAAKRLKETLHSAFEEFYSFEIEELKKQNLGQAAKTLEKLPGATRFVVAYAVQNSLGGHSIPVNDGLLLALKTLDVISDAEAAAGQVPGLERAVPKSKGAEVGGIMHQLGVEVGKSPYGQTARKRLLAIDPSCKDRLPKRPAKPEPEPAPAPKKPEPAAAKAAPKSAAKPTPEAKKPAATKKPAKSQPAAKKPAPKKAAPKKAAAKKPAAKPAPAKKKKVKKAAPKKATAAKKAAKKKATPAKRKPR